MPVDLRDHFASTETWQSTPGELLMAQGYLSEETMRKICEHRYRMADAMIEARKK